jgi:hypothetical protein
MHPLRKAGEPYLIQLTRVIGEEALLCNADGHTLKLSYGSESDALSDLDC